MKYISFNLNKNKFYFIIVTVVSKTFRNFLFEIFKKNKIYKPAESILLFTKGIGYSLAFIPGLIIKKTSKRKNRTLTSLISNETNIVASKENPYIKKVVVSKTNYRDKVLLIFYSFIVAFLNFLAGILENLVIFNFDTTNPDEEIKTKRTILFFDKIIEFFVTSLITLKIFKFSLKRHHFLGFILIIIGTLFNIIILNSLKNLKFKTFYCLGYIFYSIAEVFEMWLFRIKFISQFFLLTICGIFTIIFSFIFTSISQKICNDNQEKNKICSINENGFSFMWNDFKKEYNNNSLIILCLTLYCFLTCVFYSCVFCVIKYYNATTWIVIDYISIAIIIIIENLIYHYDNLTLIIILIGCLIIILGSFIYNELIIIHLCNLDFNTSLVITKRLEKETEENITEIQLALNEDKAN